MKSGHAWAVAGLAAAGLGYLYWRKTQRAPGAPAFRAPGTFTDGVLKALPGVVPAPNAPPPIVMDAATSTSSPAAAVAAPPTNKQLGQAYLEARGLPPPPDGMSYGATGAIGSLVSKVTGIQTQEGVNTTKLPGGIAITLAPAPAPSPAPAPAPTVTQSTTGGLSPKLQTLLNRY